MSLNVTGPFIYFTIPIFGGIPITQTTVSFLLVTIFLCTACVVLGREKALRLLEREGYDGLLIDTQGQAEATKGFAERYALTLR